MAYITDNRLDHELIALIKSGKIGIIMTDTIYGIVASAADAAAVQRVYTARGRDEKKPCIVLISDISQIWDGDVLQHHQELIDTYWPGKVSIVLPIGEHTPEYIHRNFNGTVVYRMPDDLELRKLLAETGPLIAPSANPQGSPPAMNISEAQLYFNESVDFYVDSGQCPRTQPSRIVELSNDGAVRVLR